jgi:hypothetical protein
LTENGIFAFFCPFLSLSEEGPDDLGYGDNDFRYIWSVNPRGHERKKYNLNKSVSFLDNRNIYNKMTVKTLPSYIAAGWLKQ